MVTVMSRHLCQTPWSMFCIGKKHVVVQGPEKHSEVNSPYHNHTIKKRTSRGGSITQEQVLHEILVVPMCQVRSHGVDAVRKNETYVSDLNRKVELQVPPDLGTPL